MMLNIFDVANAAADKPNVLVDCDGLVVDDGGVLVDCDGVLANFDAHVQAKFGAHPNSFSTDDLWTAINSDPEFYLHIPLMRDAGQLWYALRPYKPVVLTGCPKSNYELAAQQKNIWVKRHFGNSTQVVTCLSREKHTYLRKAKDILIDDRSSTIKKWIKAGGIGIRHRDAVTTIHVLQNHMEHI